MMRTLLNRLLIQKLTDSSFFFLSTWKKIPCCTVPPHYWIIEFLSCSFFFLFSTAPAHQVLWDVLEQPHIKRRDGRCVVWHTVLNSSCDLRCLYTSHVCSEHKAPKQKKAFISDRSVSYVYYVQCTVHVHTVYWWY